MHQGQSNYPKFLPRFAIIKSVFSCFPMFMIFRPKIHRLGDLLDARRFERWFCESTKKYRVALEFFYLNNLSHTDF